MATTFNIELEVSVSTDAGNLVTVCELVLDLSCLRAKGFFFFSADLVILTPNISGGIALLFVYCTTCCAHL